MAVSKILASRLSGQHLGIHRRVQHFWASVTHSSFFGAIENLMAKKAVKERAKKKKKKADKMLSI